MEVPLAVSTHFPLSHSEAEEQGDPFRFFEPHDEPSAQAVEFGQGLPVETQTWAALQALVVSVDPEQEAAPQDDPAAG